MYISCTVDILLVDFNALVSQTVPSYQATLLDDVASFLVLVQVVHQLRQIAKELGVALVILDVLLGMLSDLLCLDECSLDLTVLDCEHVVNLIELSNE